MALQHLPPEKLHIPDTEPLIFLAGPIQGARDWQSDAYGVIDLLHESDTLHVANPRREYLDGTFDYNAQVSWEDAGRERAAKHGAVIFWLAARDYTLPHDKDRAYGQTTRFEFGEVMGWKRHEPDLKVVLGIEPGYMGSERYYQAQADRYNVPLYDSLSACCEYIIKIVKE